MPKGDSVKAKVLANKGVGMKLTPKVQEISSAGPANLAGQDNLAYLKESEKVALIQKLVGGDSKAAKRDLKALGAYTKDEHYAGIREFQRTGEGSALHQKYAGEIESYIERAPKLGDVPSYRGVDLNSTSKVRVPKVGDTIDMGGTSSWSLSREEAGIFAGTKSTKPTGHLVYTVSGQSRGTMIGNLSKSPGEREVLVSKNAKYKVVSIEEIPAAYRTNAYTLIHLKELM